MVVAAIKMPCYTAGQGGPALHGRNGLKIIGVWDRIGAASGGNVDRFGEIAGSGAESLHLELIRCTGCQTVNRIGMGGDHCIGIGAFRRFLVVDSPDRCAGTGSPVQGDSGVGDIGGSQLMGRHTARIRHLQIIHVPIIVGGIGVVTEGNAGTRGCVGEVFGLLQVVVGGPIVVAVSVDGHEGGGVRRVGHIAHVKGAARAVGV